VPNNWASLGFFEVTSPINILNAPRPAPVSLRHVIGHLVPDLILGALAKALPGRIPAEGAAALWNIHISLRPAAGREGKRAEVLMFNSGGMGARPTLDGLSATAFPSGVHTMPIEATEQTGPIVIWRKELRPDSGGDGAYRGGLGQIMEIGTKGELEFAVNAIFDRVGHPAKGRAGGGEGAPGAVNLATGEALRTKGFQIIPDGERLLLLLPGGGGYGDPGARPPEDVAADIRDGVLSPEAARTLYGVTVAEGAPPTRTPR
jgi:N-methylhydantoinase B